jgi:catechol 2,3-dioxygenase-like lactoylglutathione lyase family enzyme
MPPNTPSAMPHTSTANNAALTMEEFGKWRSPHAPVFWAHWVIRTTRPERLVDWYQKVFGARVVYSNERLTFLTWDAESHRLAIVRMPAVVRLIPSLGRWSRKFGGIDHLSFNFGSLERLLTEYQRIKREGIEPVWCINHGPTTSIYFDDPEGVRLEFQVDNYDDVRGLLDFAASGDFELNPIGVNFDPDYLLERLQMGVPLSELRKRGSGTRPGQREVGGMKAINWKTL